MRILITGGAGFIGSHLAAALAADGHDLLIIDDLSTGKREQLPADATLVTDDVARPGVFDELVPQVDACFHLAAIASVERSHHEWLRTHQVNIGGTVNLFDAIVKSKRPIPVVYASSAAVYGGTSDSALTEISPTRPTSSYGADKLACEWQGYIAERNHSIPNIGLRFFNVYGPRQDPKSPYSGVISIFGGLLAQNKPIVIHGDGRQARDFIHVDDIVSGLRLAMEKLRGGTVRQGIFNLCTGKSTTVTELADMIGKAAGVTPVISHGPVRAGDARYAVGDPRLASAKLGFRAAVGIQDGLNRTVQWLKEHP